MCMNEGGPIHQLNLRSTGTEMKDELAKLGLGMKNRRYNLHYEYTAELCPLTIPGHYDQI